MYSLLSDSSIGNVDYTINMRNTRTVRFTKEGYEELLEELRKLQESRKEAVQEVSRAAEMGDRSENAAYKVGKQKLSSIDSRIRHINKITKRAEIIQKTKTDAIDIGSAVEVTDGENTYTYKIVGDYEADPQQGKISPNSPVGRALMGKKEGRVSVQTPTGVKEYTIVKFKNLLVGD